MFANNQDGKTDLLVEVFIPQENFADFIPDAKTVLHDQTHNLMNVTVREINKDIDTAMTYARNNVFGLVMLFTIEQTKEADKELQTRINKLIQIALDHDGTFYLPYRNYATPDQMRNSYPELLNFISFKKTGIQKKYSAVIFMII